MKKLLQMIVHAGALMTVAAPAMADRGAEIPAPGVLGLLAIGGVAAVVALRRNRRK